MLHVEILRLGLILTLYLCRALKHTNHAPTKHHRNRVRAWAMVDALDLTQPLRAGHRCTAVTKLGIEIIKAEIGYRTMALVV